MWIFLFSFCIARSCLRRLNLSNELFPQSSFFYFSAIIGTKARFSLDLGYSTFDLQTNLPSSVYLLSRDKHSAASEIPLKEDLDRTRQE